jgi:hypothetical protein
MKRFRMKLDDDIEIDVRHNGNLILPTFSDYFTSIDDVKVFVKNKLPWNFKGYGKRIEIGIHNITKEESKYIIIFS